MLCANRLPTEVLQLSLMSSVKFLEANLDKSKMLNFKIIKTWQKLQPEAALPSFIYMYYPQGYFGLLV